MMEKNHLIQLTNELYRLTLLFPKKEPLRYKMRELADDILAKCSKPDVEQNPVLESLEILDSFFEVAKNQNWVSPVEILRIQEEYDRVRAEIKKIPKRVIGERKEEIQSSNPPATRQGKILEFLKEKGKAQVWEIKKIFPLITKRTLRRDFRYLVKKGLIERLGERNETFYQIKHL